MYRDVVKSLSKEIFTVFIVFDAELVISLYEE